MSAKRTDPFHLDSDIEALIDDPAELAVLGLYDGQWFIWNLAGMKDFEFNDETCKNILAGLNTNRHETQRKSWFYEIGNVVVVNSASSFAVKLLPLDGFRTIEIFRLFTYECPDAIRIVGPTGAHAWFSPGWLTSQYTPEDSGVAYSALLPQCMSLLRERADAYDEHELDRILAAEQSDCESSTRVLAEGV